LNTLSKTNQNLKKILVKLASVVTKIHDYLKKIIKVIKMAFDKNTVKTYIDGQNRYHEELSASNESSKKRIATHIGLILALLAFLYAGALDASKSVQERLFIPTELYGQIFYAAGLFFILLALGRLIHGSRPNGSWSIGHESSDSQAVESMTEKDYLIKLKNDNEESRKYNVDQYNKKYFALKDSFYPMLLGAIIMIVLRYFQ